MIIKYCRNKSEEDFLSEAEDYGLDFDNTFEEAKEHISRYVNSKIYKVIKITIEEMEKEK